MVHCDFHCISLVSHYVESNFLCSLAICLSSFMVYSSCLCILLIGLFIFLFIGWHSLHILGNMSLIGDINYEYLALLCNQSFHSLILSFDEWKSNLSIYFFVIVSAFCVLKKTLNSLPFHLLGILRQKKMEGYCCRKKATVKLDTIGFLLFLDQSRVVF